ncbi:hypothetical protein GQ607_004822 [Colletotrichum asianum]|uniref:Uncharacterized protein n=1 Tax=Colletotrichum asianum TaxID=702518 RepID=A0A8H3WFV1_9PEZI|nr:hypothetical protein GQ607_004822 [Colletotrichum asianum]
MATVLPARSQGWHDMDCPLHLPPSLSIVFPKTVFRAISLVTGMLPRSPGPNSAQSEQQQQPSVPRAPRFSSLFAPSVCCLLPCPSTNSINIRPGTGTLATFQYEHASLAIM